MNTRTDTIYLIFHTTYHAVFIGLYSNDQQRAIVSLDKKDSSKNLLLALQQLLDNHKISLNHCAFIGAHSGPGPFTTLRVSIASVNGLAFATGLPLIGVNGLYALLDEYAKTHALVPDETRIILLDAYCGDLYYAIQSGTTQVIGVDTFDSIKEKPLIKNAARTTWLGNGVLLHAEQIRAIPHAYIPDPLPEICSIDAIAQQAFACWKKQQDITDQLIPLYLKSGSAIMGKQITR